MDQEATPPRDVGGPLYMKRQQQQPPPNKQSPQGSSTRQQQQQQQAKPVNQQNDYYDDEEEYEYDDYVEVEDDRYDDDYMDDDEEDNDSNLMPGNFWVNSVSQTDSLQPNPPRRRSNNTPPPRRRTTPSNSRSLRRKQQLRTTTFRSGTPPPPPPVAEFYNRLFWYGFDPNGNNNSRNKPRQGRGGDYDEYDYYDGDEDDEDERRTMFGGTRGKFNGLGFLGDLEERTTRPLLQPARGSSNDEYYDEDDKNDSRYDDDDIDSYSYYKDENDDFYFEDLPKKKPSQTQNQQSKQLKRKVDTPPEDPPKLYEPNGVDADFYYKDTDSQRLSRQKRVDRFDFEEDDYYDEDDDDFYDTGRRRRQRRDAQQRPRSRNRPQNRRRRDNDDDDVDESSWLKPSFNLIDSFFGFNREQRDRQAEIYNQQMGLNNNNKDNRNRRNRRFSSSSDGDDDDDEYGDRFYSLDDPSDYNERRTPTYGGAQRNSRRPSPPPAEKRRSGYAYRYNPNEDDDFDNLDDAVVADYEVVSEVDDSDEGSSKQRKDKKQQQGPRRRELTWEERAMAIERVPPANVRAWGPSGAILENNVDARSLAIQDALDDILEAKRKVKTKEERVEQAREQLSVLRVDNELEKKRLLQKLQEQEEDNRQRQRQRRRQRDSFDYYDDEDDEDEKYERQQYMKERKKILEYIRRLDQKVEEAARNYRLAQKYLNIATEDLYELERRHWAVLNSYNPSQATKLVQETLKELDETMGGTTASETSSTPPPSTTDQPPSTPTSSSTGSPQSFSNNQQEQ